MQSTHRYVPHDLSQDFLKQYYADQARLKTLYGETLTLVRGLKQSYSKAFDSAPSMSCWVDGFFNSVKKPLANHLVEKIEQFERRMNDPYCFIADIDRLQNEFSSTVKKNATLDPESLFDGCRGKSPGGELGGTLQSFEATIDLLVREKKRMANTHYPLCVNRLTYLYTALALVREQRIVLKLTDYCVTADHLIPYQPYYQSKLRKLHATINDDLLVSFVKNDIESRIVDGSYTGHEVVGYQDQLKLGRQLDDELIVLEQRCLALIHDVKLVFFEVCSMGMHGAMAQFQSVEEVLKAFLIMDFTCQLPFIEREYWWTALIQAYQIGFKLNTTEHTTLRRSISFITQDDVWKQLVTEYAGDGKQTLYAGSPTIDFLGGSLLKNALLREEFSHAESLQAAFLTDVSSDDVPLNKKVLHKQSGGWHQIAQYDDCHWPTWMSHVFDREVCIPLEQVYTWMARPEVAQSECRSSYIGQLFLRASAMVEAKSEAHLQLEPGKTFVL